MQSEHVDASITGVMRTLERKRQEAIDAAEEEGDWESTEDEYCWRNCEDDDAESVFLQEFECHDCGDSYIGREPTPDKDFPGSPECQKCKWKGWNDGWEERGDAELCCFRCTEDREVREVHDSSYYSDVAVCKDCKEELDERTSRNSGTDCASHEPVVALSADCEDGLDQTESEKSGEECTSPESIMVAAREECNEDVDETASENSEKQCA
jgi:hypothetical protein